MFLFVSVCTHFLKERVISFSSGFSGPWDDNVRRPASSLSSTTHFASSQESAVRGRSTFPPVAAAGLSKRGSSFSGNIIKMYHLFIRKFCPTFLFKIML